MTSPTIEFITTLFLRNGDETYLKALAAMVASMRARSSRPLRYWIVHDQTLLQPQRKQLGKYIEGQCACEFVDVSGVPEIHRMAQQAATARFSPAMIWRVFLTELCPVPRAIVADCDLIFLNDPARLWIQKIEDAPMAAVRRRVPWPAAYHEAIRTPPERYFRMGVTLQNLDYIRADREFMDGRVAFLRDRLPAINKVLNLSEQSLFNFYFNASALELKLDMIPAAHLKVEDIDSVQKLLARTQAETPVVLDLKGWLDRSPFDYFYWTHLLQTPWAAEAWRHLIAHQAAARAAPAVDSQG